MRNKTLVTLILIIVLPLILGGIIYYQLRDFKYMLIGVLLGIYIALLTNSFMN